MSQPKSELTPNIKGEQGEDDIGLVDPASYIHGWPREGDDDDEEDGSEESLPTSSNKASSSKSKSSTKENSDKPHKCDSPGCGKGFSSRSRLK